MNRRTHSHAFPLTAIAAALAAACAPAWPAEVELNDARPISTVSIGLGFVDSDNQRFGQYSGLRDQGAYGLLGLDFIRRNDDTGTWLKLTGRNLGLDSRELRFEHNRQGNWGYFIEYGETPRHNPFAISTRLAGVGTSVQTINGTPAPYSLDLSTERETFKLGFDKWLPRGFDVQVRFHNEEKDGARQWGQGTNNNIRFLTDPINQTTRQLEVLVGFTGERLQLSGGYYGTDFTNHNTALNVVGGIAGQTPMALPPGNQSHQFNLAGGYQFTPTTRGTFKVAQGRLTQNEAFIVPAALSGRGDLGGRIDTTLVQMGLTARPLPKLSLLANVRHEDRHDRTPIAQYNTPGGTQNGFNEPRSFRTTTGKVEAGYALAHGFRAIGGVEYDERIRSIAPVRVVSHRDQTQEMSYRAELRRSMSETVTGGIAYIHSDRNGSPFYTTRTNAGALGSNLIAPLHLADRERDKIRLSVNWQPLEPLTLQFFADKAKDRYDSRDPANLGPRSGKGELYSVDAGYTFSEKLQATAWYSYNDNRAVQATRSGTDWIADLRNRGNAFGLGLNGKPLPRLEVGADLSHSDIVDKYGQSPVTVLAVANLPDVTTRLTTMKLYARYAVQKNAGVRLNYIYDRYSTNDWGWSNWAYSDGTRVIEQPDQKVHFIGASYYYRWQ
jgi:MtrB/PioB family decaheme-associated outer membrane protein